MSPYFWLLHITIGKPQASLCKRRSGLITHRAHSLYVNRGDFQDGGSQNKPQTLRYHCYLFLNGRNSSRDTHHVAEAYRGCFGHNPDVLWFGALQWSRSRSKSLLKIDKPHGDATLPAQIKTSVKLEMRHGRWTPEHRGHSRSDRHVLRQCFPNGGTRTPGGTQWLYRGYLEFIEKKKKTNYCILILFFRIRIFDCFSQCVWNIRVF